MLELIMNFAKKDERIRGVLMNGSRVNPTIRKDIFQDYDIVYLVTDVEPFKNEEHVISHFGEIMLMQKPEDKQLPPPIGDGRYTYLIQFTDGNRIDMHIIHISKVEDLIKDSLTKVLLDKDDFIPNIPSPNENSYLIQKPTEKQFLDVCDSFIWGLGSHIPKTIWRKELPLLKTLINIVLREPLMKLLEWKIGIKNNYNVSIGKGGKKLETLLEPVIWNEYLKTYADGNYDNIWESLHVFYQLFKETALFIAKTYQYDFPKDALEKAYHFLMHVKKLPQDAISIY